VGGDPARGAFMGPRLFRTDRPFDVSACHEVEAFGPMATLMPYGDIDEAAALARRGRGSLCCSFTSHAAHEQRSFVLGAAPMHGRILVLDRDCAAESTGHGSPLPGLVHGGPGRAGGGEEMGGIRGVHHYMQRTAIQGSPSALTAITSEYQYGAPQEESEPHVFRKHLRTSPAKTALRRSTQKPGLGMGARFAPRHVLASGQGAGADIVLLVNRLKKPRAASRHSLEPPSEDCPAVHSLQIAEPLTSSLY
jgi:hypothetical protein